MIDNSEKGVTSVVSSMIFDVSSHLFSFVQTSQIAGGGGCSYCWLLAVFCLE